MIAGRSPFAGATHADTLGAIVGAEPVPLGLQAPSVSPLLEQIVGRARQLEQEEPAAPINAGDRVLSPESTSTPRGRIAKRTRLIVMPFRLLRPDPDIDFLALLACRRNRDDAVES
jgi:hypothetical protein